MLTNLKALIVVLAIAIAVFIVAKPLCLRFMAEDDFTRRRNVWFVLTLTAFISPSFWVYVLVAMPLLAWSARKDSNPVALYVLVMCVIPPIRIDIPAVIVHEFFQLSNFRVLAFAVLIPTAWRLMRSTDKTTLTLMDKLILAYVGLVLILLIPYESFTNTLRRGFLLSIDVLVLYFVVSRTCTGRRAIAEAMASFCMAAAVFAPLALFESLKRWILYGGIAAMWGTPIEFDYLFRDNILRAQVTAGQAIRLGYLMAIAFGFWLYLRSRVQSTPRSTYVTTAVASWMWLGLLAAYSRGPWLVAAVIFFAFLAIGPGGSGRLFKGLAITGLVSGLILVSPIGEHVINNLPFIGKVGAANVAYRQHLAEAAWQLIKRNPFFGSPYVLLYLEHLRQGQGIIDIVNTYAAIGMYYGLVGLGLFLGPVLVGMWNVWQLVRSSAGSDPDLSLLGVIIIACMVGTLLMFGVGGFNPIIQRVFYLLVGFTAAYSRVGQVKETDQDLRKRPGLAGQVRPTLGRVAGWPPR